MKKIIRFCLSGVLLASAATFVWAQPKQAIALGNSSNPARLPQGDVAMYEGAALTGIRQTNLCTTLERMEWEKILKERGIQKTEEFLDGKIVAQGASLGADYLLVISLQSLNASDKYSSSNGSNSRSVDATLILGANVISVETGQVKHNKTITLKKSNSYSQGMPMYNASREDVLGSFKEDFVKDCAWEFSVFMYEVFPPEITVIKVEEIKKEKAKTVLCKTSARLPEGIKLEVFSEEKIDLGGGETDVRKKPVGRLKIDKVESEKLVLCDVKEGGEAILNAMNAKTTLKCTPNFERGLFDGLLFKKKPGF